ncbi:TPA: XRE family transcriptional regulator [Bacillus cereus]|nr:XRE family transcriptional regulator [Bacillus cereus]
MNLNTQENEQFQSYKREGAVIDLRSMPIHEALRVARAADGLTQPNIVSILGFSSVPRYSLTESGQRPIPAHLMEKVQAYLYDAVEPLKEEE